MSQPSFTNFVLKRPWLKRWMRPMANWYANAAGYRQLGLRYASSRSGDISPLVVGLARGRLNITRSDDLLPEESDTVQLALKRLPPKEAYDRVFRLRRAVQVSDHLLCSNLSILTSAVFFSSSTVTQGRTHEAHRSESTPGCQPHHFVQSLMRVQQDVEYLSPIIREIEAEKQEREDLEAMVVRKR